MSGEKKRFLVVIPVCGLFALMQVLFFWLAPESDSKQILYGFMTGMLLIYCCMAIFAVIRLSWRLSMPFLVSGGLVVSGFAMAVVMSFLQQAGKRTAMYLGVSFLLLYLIIALPILLSLSGEEPLESVFTSEANQDAGGRENSGSGNDRTARMYAPPKPRVKT